MLPANTPPAPLPPLHALVAFEALVRHGSVARALAELGVSKAALCASIALLEERTGLRLLIRPLPDVELSNEGRAYYQGVATFARGAADALHGLGKDFVTELRLSASPGIARLWLAPRLASLRAACPGVAVTLSATESLSDLERGECDIAVRYCHPGQHEGAIPLWQETLVMLAPAARVAALELRTLPDVLASEALIEHPSIPWLRLAQGHGLEGLPRAPTLVCHDLYAILAACARGEGLAWLPWRLTASYCRRHHLRALRRWQRVDKQYVLLHSTQGQGRPVVQACTSALLDLATELQTDPEIS